MTYPRTDTAAADYREHCGVLARLATLGVGEADLAIVREVISADRRVMALHGLRSAPVRHDRVCLPGGLGR